MPDAGEAGTVDQASPSWSLGCLILLAAMLIVAAVISVFGLLRDYRPPVMLTASTRDLTGLQDITLTGSDAARQTVRWSLSGSVRQLAFSGFGTAEAILPLPVSDCAKMAAKLKATCTSRHQVLLSPPAAITWSRADALYGDRGRQTAASLEVAPTRAGYVNLFALGSRPPALCFDPPPQTARLKVKRGTLRFAATVPGLQTTECGTGLAVSIGTPGARNSPLIEMGSISSVAVAASAPEASAQGFAGQIVLNPGGTTIVGGPSQVTMRATGGAALRATVSTGTGGQSLDVSGAAGSVITSAGERVPSEWARNSSIVVPLFGGVVTLAVAALSGAAQELMACVKGLRPRFRRLDGWLRGQHRPRPAGGNAAPAAAADNEPGDTP